MLLREYYAELVFLGMSMVDVSASVTTTINEHGGKVHAGSSASETIRCEYHTWTFD